MSRRVAFIFLCLCSTTSYARVATSSLFPAIRSINPATISDRAFAGVNVQASKKDIETTYQPQGDFQDLNWESITTVEGVDFNSFYDTKLLNIEFYASPKRGSKKVTTQYTGNSASESESELETIGLHFLVSLKMGKYLTLGAKRTKASTDFTDKDLYPNEESLFSYSTEYDMSLDTAGYGLHLKLLKNKLHIGYGIEDVTLDVSSTTSSSQTYYNNPSNNSSSNSQSDFGLSTKKTFFGVAFFSGNIKSHGIKLEFSRETMPPILEGNTNLKDGEASIYTAEMKTKLFIGGISYKRIRGVYLDTYDIIPFFLNLDKTGNSFRSELELSFTLRLAKKGSFGGIILFSDEDTLETLDNSTGNQLYPVNRKIATYGLSYSYLF